MDFDALFNQQLDALKEEGNYRIFAEMERKCGSFPKADNYGPDGKREVTVWCSNDYLGMGQNESVQQAMADAALEQGAGVGGTRGRDRAHRATARTHAAHARAAAGDEQG